MKKNYLFNALFLAVSFVPCLTGTAGAAEADIPEAGKCYTLRACTQNSLCIQEEADGSLTVRIMPRQTVVSGSLYLRDIPIGFISAT